MSASPADADRPSDDSSPILGLGPSSAAPPAWSAAVLVLAHAAEHGVRALAAPLPVDVFLDVVDGFMVVASIADSE